MHFCRTSTFPFVVTKAAAPHPVRLGFVDGARSRLCNRRPIRATGRPDGRFGSLSCLPDDVSCRQRCTVTVMTCRRWTKGRAYGRNETQSELYCCLTPRDCQTSYRGFLPFVPRPRVQRNKVRPRSMGYISPNHMQRKKISGSLRTRTLRSTFVSQARYYVGGLHELRTVGWQQVNPRLRLP